jgi:hypothetical protein
MANPVLGTTSAIGYAGGGGYRSSTKYYTLKNTPITLGTLNVFSSQLPRTGFLRCIHLFFKNVTTIGTGTTIIPEGDLSIVRKINYYTNTDDRPLNNLNGRSAFHLAKYENGGVGPARVAFAAANGTYTSHIPINFVNNCAYRPDDTAFRLYGYKSITLELDMGGVGDLLTTPGTAACVMTCDIMFEYFEDLNMPAGLIPRYYRQFKNMPNFSPTSQTFLDYDVTPKPSAGIPTDFIFEKALWFTVTAFTTSLPWTGTATGGYAAPVISELSFEVDQVPLQPSTSWGSLEARDVNRYGLVAINTGFALLDTMKPRMRNIGEPLDTGGLSMLRSNIVNGSGASPQVWVLEVGQRRVNAAS